MATQHVQEHHTIPAHPKTCSLCSPVYRMMFAPRRARRDVSALGHASRHSRKLQAAQKARRQAVPVPCTTTRGDPHRKSVFARRATDPKTRPTDRSHRKIKTDGLIPFAYANTAVSVQARSPSEHAGQRVQYPRLLAARRATAIAPKPGSRLGRTAAVPPLEPQRAQVGKSGDRAGDKERHVLPRHVRAQNSKIEYLNDSTS